MVALPPTKEKKTKVLILICQGPVVWDQGVSRCDHVLHWRTCAEVLAMSSAATLSLALVRWARSPPPAWFPPSWQSCPWWAPPAISPGVPVCFRTFELFLSSHCVSGTTSDPLIYLITVVLTAPSVVCRTGPILHVRKLTQSGDVNSGLASSPQLCSHREWGTWEPMWHHWKGPRRGYWLWACILFCWEPSCPSQCITSGARGGGLSSWLAMVTLITQFRWIPPGFLSTLKFLFFPLEWIWILEYIK